jgi:nucleotide-binding universal stress UspA family protein
MSVDPTQPTTEAPAPQPQGGASPEIITPPDAADRLAHAQGQQPQEQSQQQESGGLEPYQERLTGLLEPADPGNPDGGTALDSLLAFHEAMMDENAANNPELLDWWEMIGEQFGWFEGDGEGGEEGEQVEGQPAEDDMPEWAKQLQQENQELRARIDGTDAETQVQQQQQRILSDLESQMQEHGIEDDKTLPEEKRPSTVILRLASTYNTPDLIARGVADYLALTGRAQGQLIQQAGQQTAPAADFQGGASLDGGQPEPRIESVSSFKDAKEIALQRLRSQ